MYRKKTKQSQPSVAMGSTPADSTKLGSKIFGKKNNKKTNTTIQKNANKNPIWYNSWLHSIYFVLGVVSNLEKIESI